MKGTVKARCIGLAAHARIVGVATRRADSTTALGVLAGDLAKTLAAAHERGGYEGAGRVLAAFLAASAPQAPAVVPAQRTGDQPA